MAFGVPPYKNRIDYARMRLSVTHFAEGGNSGTAIDGSSEPSRPRENATSGAACQHLCETQQDLPV